MEMSVARLQRVVGRWLSTGRLRSSMTSVFGRYFDEKPAFFIQVGSNDGQLGDPFCELIKDNLEWSGIVMLSCR